MKFSEEMSDWVDWDRAAYDLGVSLGIFTPDVSFIDCKQIFWENNAVGRALHETLLTLTRAGLLISRDDDESFKWALDEYVNKFD